LGSSASTVQQVVEAARVGSKIGLAIGHQDHVQGNGVDPNLVGTQKVEREALALSNVM